MSNLELFLDDQMILKKSSNLVKVYHQPTPRELVITFDKPWEGNVTAYYTIVKESSDFLRLYYRGIDIDLEKMKKNMTQTMSNGQRTCYAESKDGGKTWIKPNLGLFSYVDRDGKTYDDTNIVMIDPRGTENFTPFKDTNPECKPEERYKAIGSRLNPYLLFGYCSPDGINWKSIYKNEPLLTLYHGKFDSQNTVFWDPQRKKYVMFYRDYLDRNNNIGRGIRICLSSDFISWSEFKWLKYTDQLNQSEYQLYTNCIQPYYREQSYLIGFPNRFNQSRIAIPGHPQTGVFDVLCMGSRDGYTWDRSPIPVLKPGLQRDRWASRNNQMALGMFESESSLGEGLPKEISVLSCEGYYLNKCSLRRFTWRQDGFVSIRGGMQEGELITDKITLDSKRKGRKLVVNISGSAMGWIKAELQDSRSGRAIPGFRIKECREIFGDGVEKEIVWEAKQSDNERIYRIEELWNYPIRIKFRIKDLDFYSYRFVEV